LVSFKEFKKVDLRVGKLVETEEGKASIDLGGKTVPCEAKNIDAKTGEIVVVAVKENEAMLLAVKDKEGKYSLIVPERETEAGARVE